jgi:Icc-related predicted phosphoesterase
MNDYKYIRAGSYQKARPLDTITEHIVQRTRIEQVLATPFDGPTVAVTHHAPLPNSLIGGQVQSELDAAYASDLSALIEQHKPELWIHGHIHRNRDYIHGSIRVIANPRGYLLGSTMRGRGHQYPENPDFNPALVVEV